MQLVLAGSSSKRPPGRHLNAGLLNNWSTSSCDLAPDENTWFPALLEMARTKKALAVAVCIDQADRSQDMTAGRGFRALGGRRYSATLAVAQLSNLTVFLPDSFAAYIS
jgi:hypothetical protein